VKKNNGLGLAITLLLMLVGLVCVGISLSLPNVTVLSTIVKLAVYAVVVIYTLFDFLIPHTNIFKYVVLFFGIGLTATINELITQNNESGVIFTLIAMVLIGYMSGRLNKLGKNYILMSIILALLVAAFVFNLLGIPQISVEKPALIIARYASDVITWLALCAAYLTRFKAHKEAGEAADKVAE